MTIRIPDVSGLDAIRAACAYAAAGLFVLPVRAGQKNPGSVVGGEWHKLSSRDPQEITVQFAGTDHGIALHAGRSGLVVFDADDATKRPAEYAHVIAKLDAIGAPYQTTDVAGDRRHYLVALPEGFTAGNGEGNLPTGKGGGINVRGLNGVIIVEPSRHPKADGRYQWQRTGAVPVADAEILSWLAPAGGSSAPKATTDEQRQLLAALPGGQPCAYVRAAMARVEWAEGGRDGELWSRMGELLFAGVEGHAGVGPALGWLREQFAQAKPEVSADAVWGEKYPRRLAEAVAKAKAQGGVWPADPCDAALPATALPNDLLPPVPRTAPIQGGAPVKQSRGRSLDDIGNAERMLDLFGERFRYVGDRGIWRQWDGHRWVEDSIGQVQEAAKLAARDLLAEAAEADPGPMPIEGQLAELELEGDLKAARELLKKWQATDEGKAWAAASSRAKNVFAWAFRSQLADRLSASMKLFSSVPGVAVRAADFDQRRNLFNLLDATIDTDAPRVVEQAREHMLTKVAGAGYCPGAQAPLWRAFLEANLPDPATRHYFQKLAGYSLTGRCNEKLMAYLYGPSDTGKSIAAAVLLEMHGEYGYQAPKGSLAPRKHGDEGRDPDRHGMIGARFVVTSETRPGEPMDEALIKSLTGRDVQNTRGNYARGNTSWTPQMLLMVCSNQYPRITGDDDAIWTRIKVIPFLVQYLAGDPRRDERLQEKIIANELPGVLAWALEGLSAYLTEGLVTPPEVLAATEQFRASGDGVQRWLADGAEDGSLMIADVAWSERKQLGDSYQRWCKDNGIHSPLSNPRLYARLEAAGYEPKIRKGRRGFAGIAVSPFVPASPFATEVRP